MSGDRQKQTSLDTALEMLSDRYRRRLLVALLEHNPQNDEDPHVPDDIPITDEDLAQLTIMMRHTHLPKLEECGFIRWDRNTNKIQRGPCFDEIQPLLELIQNHADERPSEWF